MTRPDLDALQALLDKATPGPWDDCGAWVTPSHRKFTESRDENAALIVAAVNALPSLIARVRELEQERNEALAGMFDGLNHAGALVGRVADEAEEAARAAAIAMRERCAQACEGIAQYDYQFKDTLHIARGNRADDCAAAIRELEA